MGRRTKRIVNLTLKKKTNSFSLNPKPYTPNPKSEAWSLDASLAQLEALAALCATICGPQEADLGFRVHGLGFTGALRFIGLTGLIGLIGFIGFIGFTV